MTQLKSATLLINNEVVAEIPVSNPCQMWKQVYSWFEQYGDNLRVIVPESDGTPFKDFTAKRRSDGKRILVNSVKETNRGYIKAHRTAVPTVDPLDAIADQVVENDNSEMTFPIEQVTLEPPVKPTVKAAKKAKPAKKAKAEPTEQA